MDSSEIREPERVTENQNANDQLLYFTSSSLWQDDSKIVFLSDRFKGHPNIFLKDLTSGKVNQLTFNQKTYLKSYVYFDGHPYEGLGKASISLHSPTGTVYYIQGREIRKICVKDNGDVHEETIAKYPRGQMTAFTHISSDGKRLCVPTTDERALNGDKMLSGKPRYNIDKRVRKENLSSYLRVYNTETGEQVIKEEVKKAWITHVQFSPKDSDLILYNHEWPSDCGIRRMWLFNGEEHIRLRTEGGKRSKHDWTCHEMWEREGKGIIYHGRYKKWLRRDVSYIGRVEPDGSKRVEITLPKKYRRYGHFTVGTQGSLVTDGYYEEEEDERGKAQWISRVEVNWKNESAKWIPLCKNRSSWKTQDEHPHPIFDHQMNYVYFTSDFEGNRNIYRVPIE